MAARAADQIHAGDGDDTIIYDAADNWAAGAVTGGAGFDTLLFEAVLYAVDLAAYGFEQAGSASGRCGSELWSEIYDFYDTGYQLTEQQTFFDDGTSEVTVYDVNNAESWSEWVRTYDSNGQLTGETFTRIRGVTRRPSPPPIKSRPKKTRRSPISTCSPMTAMTTATHCRSTARRRRTMVPLPSIRTAR